MARDIYIKLLRDLGEELNEMLDLLEENANDLVEKVEHTVHVIGRVSSSPAKHFKDDVSELSRGYRTITNVHDRFRNTYFNLDRECWNAVLKYGGSRLLSSYERAMDKRMFSPYRDMLVYQLERLRRSAKEAEEISNRFSLFDLDPDAASLVDPLVTMLESAKGVVEEAREIKELMIQHSETVIRMLKKGRA